MTSSRSFELHVRQRQPQGLVDLTTLVVNGNGHVSQVFEDEIDVSWPLELHIARPDRSEPRGELRVGREVKLILNPGRATADVTIGPMREEFGEVVITFRETDPSDPSVFEELCALRLRVAATESTQSLYEQLVSELESIQAGLARDVDGQSSIHVGSRSGKTLHPEDTYQLLQTAFGRLSKALTRIDLQPSHAITQREERRQYVPGDRISAATIASLAHDPDVEFENGQIVAIGKIRTRRPHVSFDIPEHRILRGGLDDLACRARRVARHCQRCALLLEEEKVRWGSERHAGASIFDIDYAPRIAQYEQIAASAEILAERFTKLRKRTSVLESVSSAPARPTPLLLHGNGYRQAYAALRAVQRVATIDISGDEFRIRLRSLSKLYEYWCYLTTVAWFAKRFPSRQRKHVRTNDRPDLEPGLSHSFRLDPSRRIEVHYEPEILPWSNTKQRRGGPDPHRFRATLSDAPLRPDILVEIRDEDRPPVALVLDAKSTTLFDRSKVFAPTDYRSRVIDAATGTQPIRQVFFLHRDEQSELIENVPGYLSGTRGNAYSSIIGAAVYLPWQRAMLDTVLERFLAVNGIESAR